MDAPEVSADPLDTITKAIMSQREKGKNDPSGYYTGGGILTSPMPRSTPLQSIVPQPQAIPRGGPMPSLGGTAGPQRPRKMQMPMLGMPQPPQQPFGDPSQFGGIGAGLGGMFGDLG